MCAGGELPFDRLRANVIFLSVCGGRDSSELYFEIASKPSHPI